MATINLFKLAKTIYQYIKANGVVTRVDLNREFKAGNDFKATEALSAVLKSLIHNKHVLRHAVRDSATVFFWIPGADTELVADTNAVINPPDVDYLGEPTVPVVVAATPVPTSTFVPPEKPAVETTFVPTPPAIQSSDVKDRFSGIDLSSTDTLLLGVSDRLPFFTQTFILQTFKDVQPNILAMRLATMVNRRQLVRSQEEPYVYWNPSEPTPLSCTAFVPPERQNQSRRAKLARLNSEGSAPTDFERVVTEKLKDLEELEDPKPEVPKVDVAGADSAYFITGSGFVLYGEELKLTLPLCVSIALLQIALQLNIPEALKALQAVRSKGVE